MAVKLTGADSLFQRLGKVEDLRAKIKTHQDLIDTEVVTILDEYNADRDLSKELQPAVDAIQASSGSPQTVLRDVARFTLVEMVNDDNPQPDKSLKTALEELIAQMKSSSDTVDGNDTGATATADSGNTGDGHTVVDVGNLDSPSVELQYVRAEDVVVKCTRDSQETGTAGKDEVFSVSGEPPEDPLDQLWPGGSGIGSSLRITTPDKDQQKTDGQTVLVNGNMEDFATTDNLDNWTMDVGSFGTQIKEEGTTKYRGSKALKIVGDAGATLTKLHQAFNTSGESTSIIKPESRYLIYVRLRKTAGLLAGNIVFSLESSTDVIIGTTLSVAHGSISSSAFGVHTAIMNTPLALPTGNPKFQIEVTTALTDTEGIFVDDLVFVPMVQFGGENGPFLAVLPGATAWVRDDFVTAAMTNTKEGGFQQAFDRWFDMYGLALELPNDIGGAETIADTLIS